MSFGKPFKRSPKSSSGGYQNTLLLETAFEIASDNSNSAAIAPRRATPAAVGTRKRPPNNVVLLPLTVSLSPLRRSSSPKHTSRSPQHPYHYACGSTIAAMGQPHAKKPLRPIDSFDSRAQAFGASFLGNVRSPTRTLPFNESCKKEELGKDLTPTAFSQLALVGRMPHSPH